MWALVILGPPAIYGLARALEDWARRPEADPWETDA